jgi:pyruvate dehydrogenase E2 component (dihydrolipoamide acetyltransferase)
MVEYLIMPKLGFNMDEGTIIKWRKEEGDFIEEQEVIFEIETDKTVMEVESQISGILRKILVNEGKSIPVTLPIAIIGDKDEDISKMIEEAYQKLRESETVEIKEISPVLEEKKEVKSKEQKKEFKKISPGARKKAKEFGIEFQSLRGSGPGGVVIEKDVIDYFQLKENKSKNLSMKKEAEKRLPYTGIRKIIGDRLSQSKYTIPHVYFTIAVDVTRAIRFLDSYNTNSKLKITINDFIVFVVAKVLLEQININCSLVDEEIIYHKDINIGIAVALEEGLIVPVVKNVNKKDLFSLSQEIKKIIKLARDRKLIPDDYKGGTFTVSNLGMYGIDNFIAIINPPEAAILAIGAIKKVPIVVERENKEEVKIHSMMKITLSVDHRLIDGIVAAKFLNRVKFYLEFPESLIL